MTITRPIGASDGGADFGSSSPSDTSTEALASRLLDNPALTGRDRYLSQPHTPTPTDGPTSPGPDWGILEVSEGGSHCVGRGPREPEPRGDVPHRDRRLGGRAWGRRKPIRGRTPAASREFRRKLASISEELHPTARAVFLTATYEGGSHSDEPAEWTNDLDKLRKRMVDRFGTTPNVVSREFSRKGKVHHHIISLLPSGLNRDTFVRFVRKAWLAISGNGGASHRRRGLHAGKIRTWAAACAYLSKTPDAAHELRGPGGERLPTGKTWGVWGRKLLRIIYRRYVIPAADWPLVRAKLRTIAGHPLEPRPGHFGDTHDTHHVLDHAHEMLALMEALGIVSHGESPP